MASSKAGGTSPLGGKAAANTEVLLRAPLPTAGAAVPHTAACARRDGLGVCQAKGTHSGPDFAPQVRPVQHLHRLGKVFRSLGFDPVRPVAQHHLLPGLSGSNSHAAA